MYMCFYMYVFPRVICGDIYTYTCVTQKPLILGEKQYYLRHRELIIYNAVVGELSCEDMKPLANHHESTRDQI